MSAFDDWLAAKGKSRDAAAALDEILWLRTERQRLRLTDAEREAVETAFDAMQYAADELGLSQAECDQMVTTLRGLLDRTNTGEK